jgi:DNA-binding beta-propeller fold protein YncE
MQPINIAIEPDGTKYVADSGRNQVVVFGADDEYVKAIGEATPWRPVDVAAFEDRLYVADAANQIVKVFDKATGTLVKTIGDTGDPETRLGRPTNLAFDGGGDLYVSDFDRFQILKYDRDGHFEARVGAPGDGPGHFARPKGIAVDRAGRLYVVDASFDNVQIFDKDGRVLLFFAQGGEQPGNLRLPAKVALDYDNLDSFREYFGPGFDVEHLILVTSQFGPHAVSVFAYGREKGRTYPTEDELLRQIEEKRKRAAPPPAQPGR